MSTVTVNKTFAPQTGIGYQYALGQDVSKLTLAAEVAGVDVYVRPISYTPTSTNPTPAIGTNAMIPGAGAGADSIHLTQGKAATWGADPQGQGPVVGQGDTWNWVIVWCVTAGDLLALGH